MRFLDRVAFDAPIKTPDGGGGETRSWSEKFTCRASIKYLRGGESVMAGRLAGKQAVVVTVMASPIAKDIAPTWRMRDLKRGISYNVHVAIRSDSQACIEVTAESGVAQ